MPVAAPHVPVLLGPLLAAVAPVRGTWIDGTFGAGGYARGLLDAGADRVIGIDRDPSVFRMAQAAVATGLALSRAVVRDMVAGDAAASRIGYVTMGMSVVPMIAPILGGLIDEAAGWRAVFVAAGALSVASVASADPCPDVQVVFARGTFEPAGTGGTGDRGLRHDDAVPRLPRLGLGGGDIGRDAGQHQQVVAAAVQAPAVEDSCRRDRRGLGVVDHSGRPAVIDTAPPAAGGDAVHDMPCQQHDPAVVE